MKRIRKKAELTVLFCFLAGVLYACNQGRETNATVTPAEISITLYCFLSYMELLQRLPPSFAKKFPVIINFRLTNGNFMI